MGQLKYGILDPEIVNLNFNPPDRYYLNNTSDFLNTNAFELKNSYFIYPNISNSLDIQKWKDEIFPYQTNIFNTKKSFTYMVWFKFNKDTNSENCRILNVRYQDSESNSFNYIQLSFANLNLPNA